MRACVVCVLFRKMDGLHWWMAALALLVERNAVYLGAGVRDGKLFSFPFRHSVEKRSPDREGDTSGGALSTSHSVSKVTPTAAPRPPLRPATEYRLYIF